MAKALPRDKVEEEQGGLRKKEAAEFAEKAVNFLLKKYNQPVLGKNWYVIKSANVGISLEFWCGNWWQSWNGIVNLLVDYEEHDLCRIIEEYLKKSDDIKNGQITKGEFCGFLNMPTDEKPDHIDENKYMEKNINSYRPDMGQHNYTTVKDWLAKNGPLTVGQL